MLRNSNRARLSDFIRPPILHYNDFLKSLEYNFALAPNSFFYSSNPSISAPKVFISYSSFSTLVFQVFLTEFTLHTPIVPCFVARFVISLSLSSPH